MVIKNICSVTTERSKNINTWQEAESKMRAARKAKVFVWPIIRVKHI